MKNINEIVNTIICGDVLSVLKTFPDNFINCVVTSPPYYALRDYGIDGQIGLEPTFNEYLERLWDIFDEVKRVLKNDGTCWVNLGDTYNNGNKKRNSKTFKKKRMSNIPRKSLIMIPERFAIGMIDRGWTIRNKIVWNKTNSMPESVKDRFTKSYEYVYLFTKNKKYYFKQQLEPANYDGRKKDIIEPTKKYGSRDYPGGQKQQMGRKPMKRWPLTLNGEPARNKRDVWNIPTRGFSDAHFAVFPPDLPMNCIKAGCPENGIVLDPFIGSGTTAIVARKMGRNYIGIELNPEYVKMAKKRIPRLFDDISKRELLNA